MHKMTYYNKKLSLPSLCLLSEQLSLVTCKQRADHFTPMMWVDSINKWRFHFLRARFHYFECIKYCQKDMIQNRISSETHNWYVYATQMISQEVEGQNSLLFLAPMCFLWNNLGSVCRYITRPISTCSSQDGTGQQQLAAPIRKCMSGIGDHRFTFLIDFCCQITHFTQLLQSSPLGDCLYTA